MLYNFPLFEILEERDYLNGIHYFLHYMEAYIMSLLSKEITFMIWIQKSFNFADFHLISLSEWLTAARITDIFIPLVALFSQRLTVRLICIIGLVNLCSSLLKWIFHTDRPYWWVQEHKETLQKMAVKQFPLTCESSNAFPCSHSMVFTAFVYIITSALLEKKTQKDVQNTNYKLYHTIIWAVAILLLVSMWVSRVYLAAQFLHNCVLATAMTISILLLCDKYAKHLNDISYSIALIIVATFLCISVYVYLEKLALDIDPHWSVRMAFKWCFQPMNIRHEVGIIFLLGRDLGYLFGIALSAPIKEKCSSVSNRNKFLRVLSILLIESLNLFARSVIPKNLGRFCFVFYEFMRNLIHSSVLLNLSKLKL